MKIKVILNGIPKQFYTEPKEKVRDLLQREGIISVRNGCDGQGSCGNCSIIFENKVVNSCLLLTPQIDGKKIMTIEYFSKARELSYLQSAFVDAGIVQCGYCSPAMILAIHNLLDRVEKPTRADIKDALSAIFCRCTGYEQIFAAVDLAIKRKNDPTFKCELAPEFREDYRVIGKQRRKVDGPKLARGERAFVEDMVEPGACILKMLRSPHAHAYIKNIDTSEAETIPGVVYILTHKNCPDVYYNQAGQGFPEPSPYDRKLISENVRHVGDRVAAVVAETEEIAEEAIKKIKVEYEILPPVLTIDEAAAENAPLIRIKKITDYDF